MSVASPLGNRVRRSCLALNSSRPDVRRHLLLAARDGRRSRLTPPAKARFRRAQRQSTRFPIDCDDWPLSRRSSLAARRVQAVRAWIVVHSTAMQDSNMRMALPRAIVPRRECPLRSVLHQSRHEKPTAKERLPDRGQARQVNQKSPEPSGPFPDRIGVLERGPLCETSE